MINKILNSKTKVIFAYSLFCLGMLTLVTNCDPDETQTVTNFDNLTMQDEFDGTSLNENIWTPVDAAALLGNGSLQYYTSRPENLKVEDGMLQITANQESFEGSNYTSARIETKISEGQGFEQQYGRFEARMKLPFGKGMWPAFWLLGNQCEENDEFGAINWPDCGEIDIVENGGSNPTVISGAVHGPGYSGGDPILKKYTFENSRADEFHVYGIEWGPGYINFYVDDVLYNQITPETLEEEGVDRANWVFDNGPYYIIINLAVGGAFDGNPDANTVFPQTMLVDYVRVYSAD